MHNAKERRSPALSVLAIAVCLTLLFVIYWITKPGLATFNTFNQNVFGQYYTAAAIVMVFLYGLAFVASIGIAIAATVFAWLRGESPRWLTWVATVVTTIAPIVPLNLSMSFGLPTLRRFRSGSSQPTRKKPKVATKRGFARSVSRGYL